MVLEKIKKSESTLGGITFSILIAIFFFSVFFLWMQQNATESGRTIEGKYNTSYVGLQNELQDLSDSKDSLQSAAKNITEPTSVYGVAFGGLKGLLAVFQLFTGLIDTAWQSYQFMTSPLEGLVPRWIINLVMIGLVLGIIYIIISIFKGDSNIIR